MSAEGGTAGEEGWQLEQVDKGTLMQTVRGVSLSRRARSSFKLYCMVKEATQKASGVRVSDPACRMQHTSAMDQ